MPDGKLQILAAKTQSLSDPDSTLAHLGKETSDLNMFSKYILKRKSLPEKLCTDFIPKYLLHWRFIIELTRLSNMCGSAL